MDKSPYDLLIESASRLTSVESLESGIENGISSATLHCLDENRDALASARQALLCKCAASLRYEEAFYSEHVAHHQSLRNLCRAFQIEMSIASQGKRDGEACQIALEILELANAVRRGGLIVDLHMSIAISAIGISQLRWIRKSLNDSTRKTLLRALQTLEVEHESYNEIAARDRAFEVAVGWADQRCEFDPDQMSYDGNSGLTEDQHRAFVQMMQHVAALPPEAHREMQSAQDSYCLALLRMLIIDLGLRTVLHASTSYPDRLSQLVPDVLPSIPVDPFTGESFIYRRGGEDGFQLYSTGPKKSDGGGAFGHRLSVLSGTCDLCLDADDFPSECGLE